MPPPPHAPSSLHSLHEGARANLSPRCLRSSFAYHAMPHPCPQESSLLLQAKAGCTSALCKHMTTPASRLPFVVRPTTRAGPFKLKKKSLLCFCSVARTKLVGCHVRFATLIKTHTALLCIVIATRLTHHLRTELRQEKKKQTKNRERQPNPAQNATITAACLSEVGSRVTPNKACGRVLVQRPPPGCVLL